eukprot:1738316-Prymnesium_polylepis.1
MPGSLRARLCRCPASGRWPAANASRRLNPRRREPAGGSTCSPRTRWRGAWGRRRLPSSSSRSGMEAVDRTRPCRPPHSDPFRARAAGWHLGHDAFPDHQQDADGVQHLFLADHSECDGLDEHHEHHEHGEVPARRQMDRLPHLLTGDAEQVRVQFKVVARAAFTPPVQRYSGEAVAHQDVGELLVTLGQPGSPDQIVGLLLEHHLAAHYFSRCNQYALALHDRRAHPAGDLGIDGVGVKLNEALVRLPSGVGEERASHEPHRVEHEDDHDEEEIVVDLLEQVDEVLRIAINDCRDGLEHLCLDHEVRRHAEEAEDEELLVDLIEHAAHLARD